MINRLKTNSGVLQGKHGGMGGFDPTGCAYVYPAPAAMPIFGIKDVYAQEL